MADKKINELSLLDTIEYILKENKEAMNIYELIEKVATARNLDIKDVDLMTQLYMDITLSGKFVFVGEDKWTLKDGNLEFWDKDGYAFIQPEEIEEIEDEDIDFSEFNLADIEDLEVDLIDETDEDLDDEEDEELDEEIIEEKAYVDVGLDLVSTDEDDGVDDIDLDLDDDYDEDDYNDIMDDYEDMYDN
ncbi:DNA-directed RNA polymerase subunit delta [Acholeplasma granularum]|uniref:DNA-directed RNA polymerase subunit delta n=1 Tax=Acholeplasma granularum TaxID=264635 RepID=UPI00046FFC29|nr:DNA-directed RNA polymerase subunit delta [Acholeplasma granularum]